MNLCRFFKPILFIVSLILLIGMSISFAADENYKVNDQTFSTLVETYTYIKSELDGIGKVYVLQNVEDSSYLNVEARSTNRFLYEWSYYNFNTYWKQWNRKPWKVII